MKHGAIWARVAYAAVVALATFSEPTLAAGAAWSERLQRALAPTLGGRDLIDALRNVVLFLGWGAVWTITSPAGRAWPIVARATGAGALLSLGAEVMQLASPRREPSVLDLFTNTAGAFTGALAVAVLIVLLRAGRGQKSYVGLPMIVLAGGYGGAVLLEAVVPIFRQQRLAGSWGRPWERLGLALQDFHWAPLAQVPLLDLLLFAPAAAIAVAALAEFHIAYRRAGLLVAFAGTLAALAAELTRGMAGYPLDASAALIHALAFAAGAWLAVWALPPFTRAVRGTERTFVLVSLYVVLLALWSLRPFYPEFDAAAIAGKLSPERFVPLQSYRERVDAFSAADAMIPALQLLPLGALLAVWPVRRSGLWSAFWPGFYGVALLEIGQIFIAGRYFDVTDVLIAFASLVLGWSAARRAGYLPYGQLADAVPRPANAAKADVR